MINTGNGQKTPGLQRRVPFKRKGGFWEYFFWFLIIWAVLYFLVAGLSPTEQLAVPYSTFKTQLENGNVASVVFHDRQIRGEFRTPYQPPEAGAVIDGEGYMTFNTVLPPLTDESLIGMLDREGVIVGAEMESGSWWVYMLVLLLPWVFLIGYFIYAGRKIQGQLNQSSNGNSLFGVGKSHPRRYRKTGRDIQFDDVAGLEEAKQDLTEIVAYLKEPSRFKRLGAETPRGVLLMGPPGCGKTLLARAVAGEADIPFYSISGSEFIEMFVGVGASRVRDLFAHAKRDAPSIIFIDELDSIGRIRGAGLGGGHDEREQTLNQILSEMDGFQPHESVVVMAATNRPDVLDPALTRPGRFDRQIVVTPPHRKAREDILKIHTQKVPLSSDVELGRLAARTVGFSGADLKNLVNEAALLAGRKNKSRVESEDFEDARDKIILGVEHKEMLEEEEKRVTAYHEAGHALLAKLLPKTDPLQKVTIIPHGTALGATEQVPDVERHNVEKEYLLNLIMVRLGGRAAEKLIFKTYSSGAASDLKQVTLLARQMVCQWGMSERMGPVTYRMGEEHMFLAREIIQPRDFSEHTARLIDEEVQALLQAMDLRAYELLEENRDRLEDIAQALIERETLEDKDIESILSGERALAVA
jgi:cell division protease FtsH